MFSNSVVPNGNNRYNVKKLKYKINTINKFTGKVDFVLFIQKT